MDYTNEYLLRANQMQIEDALKSLDYDKTLVGTIIDDSKGENGRYRVQY